jgi:hypothetical protein
MAGKSGIYQLIEDRLRATTEPMTCVDLYEFPEIRNIVRDANRVSDYLGHMWRRGFLQRWYSPKDPAQKARFAYTWKESEEPVPVENPKIERLNIIRNTYSKPNVTITEDDSSVTLDFEQFTITIHRKN